MGGHHQTNGSLRQFCFKSTLVRKSAIEGESRSPGIQGGLLVLSAWPKQCNYFSICSAQRASAYGIKTRDTGMSYAGRTWASGTRTTTPVDSHEAADNLWLERHTDCRGEVSQDYREKSIPGKAEGIR
jgi:hypothetical protein